MTTAGLVLFYYLASASIASAILAVTRYKPIHSLLWVLSLFLHVAGIFLLMGAQFLAAVQVIVYAGAILIFYLFFLMLLDLPSEAASNRFSAHWPIAVGAGGAFAALLWYARDLAGNLVPPSAAAPGSRLFGKRRRGGVDALHRARRFPSRSCPSCSSRRSWARSSWHKERPRPEWCRSGLASD